MRLKTFFFPIILVIIVALFFGFILPLIKDIKIQNDNKASKEETLKTISDKQLAIEQNGKMIADDFDNKKAVNTYLPEIKVEEKIITGINLLASDASVALLDLTLAGKENVQPSANFVVSAVKPAQSQASSLQFTSATISVIGEYDKIKIFLDNLERMPILNKINSITIVKKEAKDDDKQLTEEELAASAGSESKLVAEIAIDFGYMPFVNIENEKIGEFDGKIDKSVIDSFSAYIASKSKIIEAKNDEVGTKGKTNPFLIN